ncbi:MAG: hypothetical protein ACPGWR_02750 [Ardenticatenaceae bacterium]
MQQQQQATSTIPEIRTFQFDKDSIGAIKNSINLFRGDVNFSLNLVSLPSTNDLNVEVNVLYTSNVQNDVNRWSLDAPTGILGMGWSMPYERIEVQHQNSASLENNKYVLTSSGNQMPLWCSAQDWSLFESGLEFADSLNEGMVSDELRNQFAEHGIALSSNCAVMPNESLDAWQVEDHDNERVFDIRQGSNSLQVYDGGLGFETQSYQFWKIRYYPQYERWMIVKENGLISTYGGNRQQNTGKQLQWGVRWGNWIGNSALTDGQEQYVIAWNLAQVANQWGDGVQYTYSTVEQAVGEGGLPYTKACYLESISDSFQQKIIFHYEEKEVSDSPDGPREYIDPHKAVPNNEPNAYQDRYETRFLDYIEVQEQQGETLFSVHFEYELQNVTDFESTDALYGDSCKRFLRKIIQRNASGDSLPGLEFDYAWNSNDQHPGALRSITYPQGGQVTYNYEKKELPITEKSLQVARPTEEPTEAWVPRVWFAPDYAVVLWYNTDSEELDVTIYTWLGYWYESKTPEMTFEAGFDLDDLNVIAGNEFFALFYFYRDNNVDKTTLHLFHKKDNFLGQWQKAEPIEYTYEYHQVSIVAGEEFLLVLHPDEDTLYQYTWAWQTKTWDSQELSLQETFNLSGASGELRYYVTAAYNYYLVLCYDRDEEPGLKKSCLQLYYLDNLGVWQHGDSNSPTDLVIASLGNSPQFYWSPGESFAVATHVTRNSDTFFHYGVRIFGWDQEYKFTTFYTKEELRIDNQIQFVASVVQNNLVGSGPYLFRYNGQTWQFQDMDLRIPANENNEFWFAYHQDVALMTQSASSQIICTLGVYNPDTDSVEWATTPQDVINETDTIPDYRKRRYYPTAGQDYITLDNQIYYRGRSNDWSSLISEPMYTIPDSEFLDTTTTQNQAPSFIAYLDYEDEETPKSAEILNLMNGQVTEIEPFDEKIFRVFQTESYLNGKLPAGPSSLFTYPLDTELNDAPHITLRRYLHGTVSGTITDYRVSYLEIDDGYDSNYTCYDYDENSASCDPTGQVVKYYRVRVYPGCQNKEESQEGFTESLYINGLPSDDELIALKSDAYSNAAENYSVLDGFLLRRTIYAHGDAVNPVAYEESDWLVKREINSNGVSMPIRGTYVLSPCVRKIQDGVVSETVNTYDLSSGLTIKEQTSYYNSRGEQETLTKLTTYGYQKYNILRVLNMLTSVAQSTNETDDQITAISVSTFKNWEENSEQPVKWGLYRSYQAKKAEALFDFDSASSEEPPATDWLKVGEVFSRTKNGIGQDTVDVDGIHSSMIFDQTQLYPIAQFVNASLGEATYVGFEEYEALEGWRLNEGTVEGALVTGDAHTGLRSLQLDPNITVGTTLSINNPNQRYILSAWLKTEADFASDGGQAEWNMQFYNDTQPVGEPLVVAIDSTNGAWQYWQTVMTPNDSGTPINKVTLTAFNRETSKYLLLDDIRFSPLVGGFQANVYEPKYKIVTAQLGNNADTMHIVYDAFQRKVAEIGPFENVNRVGMQYLTRQAGR